MAEETQKEATDEAAVDTSQYPDAVATLVAENPEYGVEWENTPDYMQDAYANSDVDNVRAFLDKGIKMRAKRAKRKQAHEQSMAYHKAQTPVSAGKGGGGKTDVWSLIVPVAAGALGIGAAHLGEVVARGDTDIKDCEPRFIVEGLEAFVAQEERFELKERSGGTYAIQIQKESWDWEDLIKVDITPVANGDGGFPQTKVVVGQPLLGGITAILEDAGESVGLLERLAGSFAGGNIASRSLKGILNTAVKAFDVVGDNVLEPFKDAMVRWRLWVAIDKATKPREDHYYALEDQARRDKRELERAQRQIEAFKKCPACGTPYGSDEVTCSTCNTPRLAQSLEAHRNNYQLKETA